jgi:hypothetical protein
MPLDMLDADAAIIRRIAAPHRDDVLREIAAEYRTFMRTGPQLAQAFDFHVRAGTAALRNAMTVLSDFDGNWRKPLPTDVRLGHVERRWQRHIVSAGKIDRTHWEVAPYGAFANALERACRRDRTPLRMYRISHGWSYVPTTPFTAYGSTASTPTPPNQAPTDRLFRGPRFTMSGEWPGVIEARRS